jgi:hypothetical protein
MRLNVSLQLPVSLLLLTALCSAGVVDRVAIVIDKTIVTESEVLDELQLTAFLNDQALDTGPAARRAAADRLVDQELIRREFELSGFARPPASEADALLLKFRQARFHSPADYGAALQKYGIAEDQLKQRLLWQLTAIRFTDFRFGGQQTAAGAQSADRADSNGASASNGATLDQQMDAWLKQARANAKIAFKPEAFQ